MSSVDSSCSKLWVLLSGTTLLKSDEEISQSLDRHADKVIKGTFFYEARPEVPPSTELQTLEELCHSGVASKFIQLLSILLDVKIEQCYELFCIYLLHEYTGTTKTIEKLFESEKSIQELLAVLWEFYHDERIYALFSMKQILSHWHTSSKHHYQGIFNDFMTKHNENKSVVKLIIAQLRTALQASLPTRFFHGSCSPLTEPFAMKWFQNNLKERFELTQLAILAFTHLDLSVEEIHDLFTLITESGGARYAYSRQVVWRDREMEAIMDFTNILETLLIVEILHLNKLYRASQSEGDEHVLLNADASVRDLDNFVRDLNNSYSPNSVIFLGWIIVRQCWEEKKLEGDSNEDALKQLSKNCLTLKVFQCLNQFLSSGIFRTTFEGTHTGHILKLIISRLISLFSIYFEIEELPDTEAAKDVFEITAKVLNDDTIAAEVFNEESDCGLLIALKSMLLAFPISNASLTVNRSVFFKSAISIAQTTSCLQFVSFFRSIDTFAEVLDPSSRFIRPHEEGFLSIQDRITSGVTIKKGVIGKTLWHDVHSNAVIISWQGVKVNGWKALADVYRTKIETVQRGEHDTVNEEYLQELTLINSLCAKIIATSSRFMSDFEELVEVALEGFKLFARFGPNRLYIASVIDLSTALLILPANFQSEHFWDIFSDLNLMPYMIGLRTNIGDLVAMHDTNTALIGHTIAAEECVLGEYDLCIAYLRFVTASLPLVTPIRVLASLLHIFAEIFPSYKRWHYKNAVHQATIGYYCFEAANVTLGLEPNPDAKKVVDICLHALLNGNPGNALLQIIRTGKERVKAVFRMNGSALVLVNKEVVMIRRSLSVMNQLLYLKEKSKAENLKLTAVEQAFFETSPSKPNMLLILAHYVFQSYDSRLAALAGQLLKRLAKHFPMSMIACLGSEAEAVRSHFLVKLNSITEDVRVKVALLDFLAACVKHQPGLMEMFLNLEADESDDETNSCLVSVLEILEVKKKGQFFCPIELHTAAIRFLFAFWRQSHLLAIDQLKKQKELWALVCFPIFPEEGSQQHKVGEEEDKLVSYILGLLAREFFFTRRLEKEKFDAGLEEHFKNFPEILSFYSDYIESKSRTKCITEDGSLYALLSAWRDLVISLAKFEPFPLSDDLKKSIYINLLRGLEHQLQFHASSAVNGLFADVSLMVFKKWSSPILALALEDWATTSGSIIYAVNEQKTTLSSGLLVTIQALMTASIRALQDHVQPNDVTKAKMTAQDWMTPTVGLVIHSLRMFEFSQNIVKRDEVSGVSDMKYETRLVVVSLALLNSLVSSITSEHKAWLPLIKRNVLIESLGEVLCSLIEAKQGKYQVAQAIMSTFLAFSSAPETAWLIESSDIRNVLNKHALALHGRSSPDHWPPWMVLYHLLKVSK